MAASTSAPSPNAPPRMPVYSLEYARGPRFVLYGKSHGVLERIGRPDPAPIEGKQPPMRPAPPRLIGIVCCLLLLGAPEASRAMDLAAHRAFYRLTLSSTENSGVTNAAGAMEYEVIDGCTGWATQQRLDMTVLDREGGDTHTVSDYSTWESKDGKNFRFRITQSTNDDREVRAGWAGRAACGAARRHGLPDGANRGGAGGRA
jgi:hypothetical protein